MYEFDREKLRELRLNRGLSMRELGRLLGVAGSTVRRWELGESEPAPKNLRDLRELFGTDFRKSDIIPLSEDEIPVVRLQTMEVIGRVKIPEGCEADFAARANNDLEPKVTEGTLLAIKKTSELIPGKTYLIKTPERNAFSILRETTQGLLFVGGRNVAKVYVPDEVQVLGVVVAKLWEPFR